MVCRFADHAVPRRGLICADIQVALAVLCQNGTDLRIERRHIDHCRTALVTICSSVFVQILSVRRGHKQVALAVRQQDTVRSARNVGADICPRCPVVCCKTHPCSRTVPDGNFAVREHSKRLLIRFDRTVKVVVAVALALDVVRQFSLAVPKLNPSRRGEYIVIDLERGIVVGRDHTNSVVHAYCDRSVLDRSPRSVRHGEGKILCRGIPQARDCTDKAIVGEVIRIIGTQFVDHFTACNRVILVRFGSIRL